MVVVQVLVLGVLETKSLSYFRVPNQQRTLNKLPTEL